MFSMKKILFAALAGSMLVSGNSVFAQSEKCANTAILEQAIAKDPSVQQAFNNYREDVLEQTAAYEQEVGNSASKTTAVITIPVIFHVVLTQAQIDALGGTQVLYDRAVSQLGVLNECFNAKNADVSSVPSAFQSVLGNAELSFAFAHRKPDGKATPGLEIRIAPPSFAGFSVHDGAAKRTSDGGLDPWDNSQYLNIWVVLLTDPNILGYGYSQKYADLLSVPLESGVVITSGAFGKKKSVSDKGFIAGADRGRTLVHELGHFFNLWHVWGTVAVGSGSCTKSDPKYDDGVTDTPPQKDANQICPGLTTVLPNCTSTPGGEMFMNYMDYPGDACIIMFTKGQVNRMRAELAPGGGSPNLGKNGNLLAWPTDVSNLEIEKPFFVAPNPSTGNFTISFDDVDGLQNINIINIMGQSVKNINTGLNNKTFNFDLSGMAKGIYTVQCRFEEGTIIRKIVLQ
jgi:hypothetical protein